MSNPDWPDPNRNTSTSQISQRVFDDDDDLIRVSVIKPIPLEVSDIQIGAVEIKDGDSDTRADVAEVGGNNGLVVQNAIDQAKSKVNIFGSTTVSPGVTVTLATYTVPVGKAFTFTGGIVGGTANGEFHFEIAGSDIAVYRNSGSNPSCQLRFVEPPTATAGSIINIKVKNCDNKTRIFESTLSGYTLDT